jgi:hypothetical protein
VCKCVYKKCGIEESSFFLSWKKVAFLTKANGRYFYHRFVIICVFLRCFLVIEKQLYLKSSIQIYILLLLCLFRDSSLARYGHLSSLSFLSLTLSLSLSLSLSCFCYCCCERKEQESSFREKSSESEFEATNTLLRISLLLTKSVSDSSFSLSLSSPSL